MSQSWAPALAAARPARIERRGAPHLALVIAGIASLGVVALTRVGQPAGGSPTAAPAMVLGGVAALAAVALLLSRIEYGVILLPLIAVAVPFSVGTGTASVLVASLLFAGLLAALFVVRLMVRGRLAFARSPVTLPLVGFVLTAVLAMIDGEMRRDVMVYVPPTWTNIQVGGLSTFVLSASTLLVALNCIRELRWIRWLAWTYLAVAGAAIGAYFLLGRRDIPGFSVGGLYSLWIVALALGQLLFNRTLPVAVRVALVGLVAAWVTRRLVFETDWLSGWLPMTLAALVLSLLRSRRLFVATLLVCAVAAAMAGPSVVQSQVEGQEAQGNFLRLDLWVQNMEVTAGHQLLGTGPAGYAPYYGTYFPDRALSTHSNYLDIFSQTGLVGSAFFVWFVVAVLRVGRDARRRWPIGFAGGFANGVIAGFAGTLLGMALGDWVIPFVYNQTIAGFRYTVHTWVLLGALASLVHVTDAASAADDPIRGAADAG